MRSSLVLELARILGGGKSSMQQGLQTPCCTSLPRVLAPLATLRGEGTAVHTRYSPVPAPSSQESLSLDNPAAQHRTGSQFTGALIPAVLQASCMTLSKILILSLFSFQQYIIAITYQPHKHVARLNPFVSHLTTNLRNADCYDYDYDYYCHFGTVLSQPWLFCSDICTYSNLQLRFKCQFPQKIFAFLGTVYWIFTLKGP